MDKVIHLFATCNDCKFLSRLDTLYLLLVKLKLVAVILPGHNPDKPNIDNNFFEPIDVLPIIQYHLPIIIYEKLV
jgi:hypothetical protein